MGKFVPDRDFVNEVETEKRIREVLREYNENITKFEVKDNRRAGVRARANLLELWHLCRTRRKEISDRSKTLGYWYHPSWDGVEEDETV